MAALTAQSAPADPNAASVPVVSALADMFESRLGGMMLLRLELTDLLERFAREESELAASLQQILRLRDQEAADHRAQLDEAHAYAHQLELRLQHTRRCSMAAANAVGAHGAPPHSWQAEEAREEALPEAAEEEEERLVVAASMVDVAAAEAAAAEAEAAEAAAFAGVSRWILCGPR